IAYFIWAVAMVHLMSALARRESAAIDGALTLTIAITIQAAFGIITLLHQAPIALSLTHQGMAMVVLTIAVVHAQRMSVRKAETEAAALSSAPVPERVQQ